MEDYILEMRGITKDFPGVRALNNVNFKVKRGEVHALVGENGAGKSTLMKILSGVYSTDSHEGKIYVNGQMQYFKNIKDSEIAGISIIYQELTLVKLMSIAENIFLGNEIKKNGIINWNEAMQRTKGLLKEVGLNEHPDTQIISLGIGKQQLVEIAKAIAKKTKILIMDEPTAALNEHESENLLDIMRELKKKGVTCIYISHKLNEVLSIADTITVLRDGNTIISQPTKDNPLINQNWIISNMVGRTITQLFPRKQHTPGDVVLEVKNWNVHNPDMPAKKMINNVNFNVRKGEILGIAGLMGAGRTELLMSLIGAYGVGVSGQICMDGKCVNLKNPREAIQNGLSYLSEDRKGNGLVLGMSIMENISLASLEKISKNGAINNNEEIKIANEYKEKIRIKAPSIEQKVEKLSGGNQQKVAISKWLMTGPKVLILDEPTRGIDVGAKFEIYNLMNELVDMGMSIIMISSELPEVLGMSDRILVMHDGTFKANLKWEEATQERVMFYATGGN